MADEWSIFHSRSDPLLEVYELYDNIVADIFARFCDCRIMIATGLHQDPHENVTFYYRLRNHHEFLSKVGVTFKEVIPRMSRDFHVQCRNDDEAATAENILTALISENGVQIFEVDNRGSDIFVMLTYPGEITTGFEIRDANRIFGDFDQDVTFVAIKNGQHNGIGYLIDTAKPIHSPGCQIELASLYDRVIQAFDKVDANKQTGASVLM